jgi:hypothetical protein
MAINCEAKTHVIDGVTYVEVDRKAEVGDKILVTNNGDRFYKKGDYAKVTKVFDIEDYGINVDLTENKSFYGDGKWGIDYRDYVVLEPVQTVEESQASPAIIEMLTSLSRKIVSLESQLRDTQNNLEKQAEELEEHKHYTDWLGNELANTRHRLMKYADRFAAVEDKVEMLTDDIVELDSRSQVLNAINKYYAEGSR